ncbi:MAG: methyl-accepting chemotaxis protein, partial [Lachnospiraceae bacterium]|nr:methyl-accepting chemotaxis protein [Lachnospiraceae bacterium]
MVRRIILIAAVLALVMTAAIGIVGFYNIRKAYFDSFSEELKAAAYMMKHEIDNEWEGDWSLSDG